MRKPVAVTQNQNGSESVTSEGANTSHQPQLLPRTHYAEGEVLNSFAHTQRALYRTAISRRYHRRTACEHHSHRTHRSFAPRSELLRARLFADTLGPRPQLASPSATQRAKKMLALVAERRGECCLAPDLCFRHVTAATVERTARQPERRRRHIQPIVTRRV